MEAFRDRVRRHDDAAGWLAGRRAWSAVRTAAVLDSDSVMRRTMRNTKAQATPPAEPAAPETQPHPELLRLRSKLQSDDPSQIARGARLLLELKEPESLEEARRRAFAGAAGPAAAEAALAQAWERFRHDRHRALN